MKQLSILIALLISLLSIFSSVGLAEKFKFLKVPDYKNINLYIEEISKNYLGVTADKVRTTTKLSLMRNGLKIDPTSLNFIYVNVQVLDIRDDRGPLGCTATFNIFLEKIENGISITSTPTSVGHLSIHTTYQSFQQTLQDCLDDFIVNYLESNME